MKRIKLNNESFLEISDNEYNELKKEMDFYNVKEVDIVIGPYGYDDEYMFEYHSGFLKIKTEIKLEDFE